MKPADDDLQKVMKEAHRRLLTDPRMVDVRRKLEGGNNPIEKGWVDWLIENVPNSFAIWEWVSKKRLPEIKADNQRISKQMIELAAALDSFQNGPDPCFGIDFSMLSPEILSYTYNLIPSTQEKIQNGTLNPHTIVGFASYIGGHSITNQNHPVPSLSQYLRGCAAYLDDWGINPGDEVLFSTLSRKRNQKTFFIREVHGKILAIEEWSGLGPRDRKSPNLETAVIVTILLNLKKPITANEVFHAINPVHPKEKGRVKIRA